MDPILEHPDKNLTDTSFIEDDFKIERLEAFEGPYQVFLVILYSLTSFIALIGNVTVIIVEIFGKRSALNMRKFLINLAVSDILLGVLCVPFTYTDFMLGRWIFWDILCPVAQFCQILSVFVSAYTLTIIGIERYLAILYPLSRGNVCLSSHCNAILISSWIIGSLLSSVALTHTSTKPFQWENQTYYDCRGIELEEHWSKVYITSVFMLTFAIPLIIQCFTYSAIGRKLLCDKLRNNELPLRRNTVRGSTVGYGATKIVRMLVAVVILFAINWLPIKIFMLLLAWWPDMIEINDNVSYYLYYGSFFFCHWLAMSNSFVNPIIYSFMSRSFRADLKDIIPMFSCREKEIPSSFRRKSTMSTT